MNYLQGTVVSVKGDRGEKVSESASSLKAHAPSACGRSTSCFFHGGKTKRSIEFYAAFCFSFALFMSGSGRAYANNSSSRLIYYFFLTELQDRSPQRMCSREPRLPPSSKHRLCAAGQCQHSVSQCNLIGET